jgi:hypothetical protein
MTRKQAMEAIKAAGGRGDQRAMMRLYVENRISLEAARKAYAEGERLARFIEARDAKIGGEAAS